MDRFPRAAFFRRAHALCRKTLQPGDSYRVTFGACLRHLYAQECTQKARHAFLQEHAELILRVVSQAARKRQWLDEETQAEDLHQDLLVRLLEVDPYDPSKSSPQTWIWWQLRAVLQHHTRQQASHLDKQRALASEARAEDLRRTAEAQHAADTRAAQRVDLQRTLDTMPVELLACVASKAMGQGDQGSRDALGVGRRTRDMRIRRWRKRRAQAAA